MGGGRLADVALPMRLVPLELLHQRLVLYPWGQSALRSLLPGFHTARLLPPWTFGVLFGLSVPLGTLA